MVGRFRGVIDLFVVDDQGAPGIADRPYLSDRMISFRHQVDCSGQTPYYRVRNIILNRR